MAKEKACKECKTIYEGAKCTNCGSTESSDSFKGKIKILNTEESEIAKNLKIDKKGYYTLKT